MLTDPGYCAHDRGHAGDLDGRMERPQCAHGRIDLRPTFAGRQLGVLRELSHRAHAGVGDPGLVENRHELVGRAPAEDVLDDGVHGVVVLHPGVDGGEALVRDHVRSTKHPFTQVRPLPFVLDGEKDHLAVSRRIRTVRCDGGVVCTRAGRGRVPP